MSGRKIPNDELKTVIYTELTAIFKYTVIESSWIDEDYPYVHVSEVTSVPWDTKNKPGSISTVRFHCWSKVDSEKEVSAMMQWVGDKIGYTNDETTDHLTLTNWDVVGQYQDSMTSVPSIEVDMPLRHGILDIRFELRQK